jgi:hypothetical protein
MFVYHAVLMTGGFLCMTTGVIIAVLMRKKRWWLTAHTRAGHAGATFVLLGLITAVYMVSLYEGEHFAVLHAYLGLLSVFCAVLTLTLGRMQFIYRQRIATIRPVHRWSGRITIIILFVTILSGLVHAGII